MPRITNITLLATIDEPICDIAYYNNNLYLGPYLSYKKCKIYVINTRSGALSVQHPCHITVESVYRIWKSSEGYLYLQTEQPPLFYQQVNNQKWELIEKYANKGWAVLGCTTSSGKTFRGFSYKGMNTVIKIKDKGKWKILPTIGKKIVWTIEYFKGTYYAGTSPTIGYKRNLVGSIFRYNKDKKIWIPIKGLETDSKIGGVICSLTAQEGIFFGTTQPQTILYMSHGIWKQFYFSDSYEISRIWKDPTGRIFSGSVSDKEMAILEWKRTKWVEIFKTNATPGRWNVLGYATGHKMYVTYRDKNRTKIISFLYH